VTQTAADSNRCIPRGQPSPACSAIDQQFTRGSPASAASHHHEVSLEY
jgi:hypothetical protein